MKTKDKINKVFNKVLKENTKTKKAVSVKRVRKAESTKAIRVSEVFKSLSGKSFPSKAEYLTEKLKRPNTKFTKGYTLIADSIKKNKERITLDLVKELGFGISPNLITNRNKGYLGLISNGDKFRIENSVTKNLPKGDKSNGNSDLITKFDLVKN